jgi:hypothetical protein
MYEALEHWKQYKQKKYPTMNELLEMEYTKPGAMVLDEMIEAEELQAKIAKEFSLPVSDNSSKLVSNYDTKEFNEWMSDLIKRNGTTKY